MSLANCSGRLQMIYTCGDGRNVGEGEASLQCPIPENPHSEAPTSRLWMMVRILTKEHQTSSLWTDLGGGDGK